MQCLATPESFLLTPTLAVGMRSLPPSEGLKALWTLQKKNLGVLESGFIMWLPGTAVFLDSDRKHVRVEERCEGQIHEDSFQKHECSTIRIGQGVMDGPVNLVLMEIEKKKKERKHLSSTFTDLSQPLSCRHSDISGSFHSVRKPSRGKEKTEESHLSW